MTEQEIKEAAIEGANKSGLLPNTSGRGGFLHGFEDGAKWAIDSNRYIPYQCCPVCNGTAKILQDGFTSAIYKTCDVCNGNKIIPMFSPAT